VSAQVTAPRPRPPAVASDARRGAVLVLGILATVAVTGGVLILFSSTSEATGALVLGVVLFVVSLPALARAARREGDRTLFWLLALALALKLLAAVGNYFVAYRIYGGVADADYYHDGGVLLAPRFEGGDILGGFGGATGTDFIRALTGFVYSLVGPNTISGFVVFSWLAFWGMYYFYRAYRVAVPEGRPRTYALLLFFLPSMLFWPSAIGKEAWMLLGLGVAAYGAARIMTGRTWMGLAVTAFGLWLAALVRPHVAGLMAIALVAGYLVRRPRRELGVVGPIAKGIALVAIVMLALALVQRTNRFFEESNFETGGGIVSILQQTTERNAFGGSEIAVPSIFQSPSRAPLAVATVLFRPLIFDAHNVQATLAGIEGTFLLLLFFFRFRWGWAAVRSIRRQPYVALALVYVALFVVAFSAFANFGLLARERVQLMPMFLIFATIPPRTLLDRSELPEEERSGAA
jgi:hypothetical protein